MKEIDQAHDHLADIASEKPELLQSGGLDQVGMSQIEAPLLLEDGKGHLYRTAALVDAFVSLTNPSSRGIHMSRLYKITQDLLSSEKMSLSLLSKILYQFLDSHDGISDSAKISTSFSALVERKALKSDFVGFRSYPIQISAEQNRGRSPRFFLEVNVMYSSTCPASAALSRQLIQAQFLQDFEDELISKEKIHQWLGGTKGIRATPHAQRSHARVKIELKANAQIDYIDLIDLIEEVLVTPVQSIVKREDEQEFARLNGQNLMFCEDAARRIQGLLESVPDVVDYLAEMRHLESLHPHDAVARVSKRQSLHF